MSELIGKATREISEVMEMSILFEWWLWLYTIDKVQKAKHFRSVHFIFSEFYLKKLIIYTYILYQFSIAA